MRKKILPPQPWAVTLMELLVVVLIVSVLATVATGVYTGEARRARIAAGKDLVRQLEVAITRYEVDTGAYPPSGSGSGLTPTNIIGRLNGSGYLNMALVHSMSGNAQAPASLSWHGPYINLQAAQTAAPAGSGSVPGMVDILDPWEMPIFYVQHADYSSSNGNFWAGTNTWSDTAKSGANPALPAPNPYYASGETFYNPSTYQIVSFGPNRKTFDHLLLPVGAGLNYAGAELDDVTNFGY